MIIDVRSEGEYTGGHHAGAINVPLDNIASHDFGADKSVNIVVYCASGARAQFAKMILTQRGYTNVELLNGTGAL